MPSMPFPDLSRAEAENPEGVFKVRVAYGERSLSASVSPYAKRRVETARIVESSGLDYSFKYADRSEIERLRGQRNGCDEIILSREGRICDSSYANLLFGRDGRLFTPKTFLLNGTKRQSLLQKGLVSEADIRASTLRDYEFALLINAMLDIEDNVRIETSNIF